MAEPNGEFDITSDAAEERGGDADKHLREEGFSEADVAYLRRKVEDRHDESLDPVVLAEIEVEHARARAAARRRRAD